MFQFEPEVHNVQEIEPSQIKTSAKVSTEPKEIVKVKQADALSTLKILDEEPSKEETLKVTKKKSTKSKVVKKSKETGVGKFKEL